MRIFILSKNRPKTICSHVTFESLDYTIVVHNEDQLSQYIDNPTVPRDRVVVSGVPGDMVGLIRQRQWVLDNLVEKDEWFVFADDNIRRMDAVCYPYYDEEKIVLPVKGSPMWRKRYRTLCPPARIADIFDEVVQMAERTSARLCGFATNDNYYFRSVKWKHVKFVVGKLKIQKGDCGGIPYDISINREDYKYTAENLLRYGRILVNNFAMPRASHYQQGGCGSYAQRAESRKDACSILMEMFPGLFRYRYPKTPKDAVPGVDIAFRIHTLEQVERWRESMRGALVYVDKTPVLEER